GSYYFTPTPGLFPQIEMMDGVIEVDKDGTFLLPIGNPFETLARFSKGDQVGVIEPAHTVTFKEWQCSLYAEIFGPANPPAVKSEGARGVAAGEQSLRPPSALSAKPATEQTPPPKATSSREGDQLLKRLGKLKEMLRIGRDATPHDVKKLLRLVMKYHDVFAVEDVEMGDCDRLQAEIDAGDAEPIQQPLRVTPLFQRQKIDGEVDKLLQMGIITKSKSDWAQPLIAVSKKDGGTRICVDFRRLNAVTRSNAYPSRTADLLERIGASLGYCSEDPEWGPRMSKLQTGHLQVHNIKEQDRLKTAFRTHRGLYEFVRLPMGLKTAGSIFQRLMSDTFHG
ncbi:MAG: RNA-directed DNA polymerase, partial [Deltaproteobacteria bacterium]|nr:RNA-directed DNA polymerase [Deltaproteobacteria bacterium]